MREVTESTFKSFDGENLFYRHFLPEETAESGDDLAGPRAVLLFHRGHEHSGRLVNLVSELNLPHYHFFAWDQRGHGRSPGERGYSSHLMDLIRDVEYYVRHIENTYNISAENIVIVSHSVSAVVVGLWIKLFAPRLRGVVMATPALSVKLYVPFALSALRVVNYAREQRLLRPLFIKSYVSGRLLTHDQTEAKAYDSDPLVSKQIAANILVELADGGRQLVDDAGAIETPLLLLSARADWVVKNLPQRRLFARLSSQRKHVRVFRGLFHSLFHERPREEVVREAGVFIEDCFAYKIDRSALLDGDKYGYTFEEYQWLNAGLPLLSLRRVGFKFQQLLLRTLGKLSDGIRIGWQTGFDSGESLDHVYTNQPSGRNLVGRFIDRVYLNVIGWRGIRQRKLNLEQALLTAIDMVVKRKNRSAEECLQHPIRIVDLAGGPARYLLDLMQQLPSGTATALIRDLSESSLTRGRGLAQQLGVTAVEYQLGDAFSCSLPDEVGLRDIAVVSGLFELFPSNTQVRQSLSGLAKILEPGAVLVYTNQPWHPQLEMIAEVLVNREQKPWVMRRRTQAEIDELVAVAGFRKKQQWVDNFGIFTVSLAVRS